MIFFQLFKLFLSEVRLEVSNMDNFYVYALNYDPFGLCYLASCHP